MSPVVQYLLEAAGILGVGAVAMVLIDVFDARRRRRIQRSMETFGRKRVGL